MGAQVGDVILGMDDPFGVVHVRARAGDPVDGSLGDVRLAHEGVVEGGAIGSGHRPGGAGIGLIDADDVHHGVAVKEGQTVVTVEIGDGVGHVRDGLDLGIGARVGDHENIVVGQSAGEGHAVGGGPGSTV